MDEKVYFIQEQGKLPKELDDFKSYFCKGNKLAFVGKFVSKEDKIVVYSCPKYIDKGTFEKAQNGDETARKTIISHIELILNVLRKMERKKDNVNSENIFSAWNSETNENVVEKISLAEYIMEDYLNHGLYYENRRITGRQPKGRISWNRTVQKITPYIDGDDILYMKLIRKYKINDYSQLITRIHASAVCYAYELIKHFGKFKNISLPETVLVKEEDLPQCVGLIRQYMRSSFSNRDIFLFRALEAWCKSTRYYERLIFGTTSFELVWQNVNDRVFGNKSEKDSDNPTYYFYLENGQTDNFQGTGNSQVDTMYIDDKKVAVFDSKYYVLPKYPPNSDIAKQIGYLDQIRKDYPDDYQYSNSFLLPSFTKKYLSGIGCESFEHLASDTDDWNEKWFNISGYAVRGKFKSDNRKKTSDNQIDDKYSHVLVIHVDPDKVYEKYLKDEKISPKEIEDILIKYQNK